MAYKVLVVDDESAVRGLFSDLLKKEKYIVRAAASGEEALLQASKEDFDVVLLDIKLSGISGIDVLKRLKEMKPGLTVIMITGFGYDEDLVSRSKEYGCSGYIGKSLPIQEIMSKFRSFVESAKAAPRKEDQKI